MTESSSIGELEYFVILPETREHPHFSVCLNRSRFEGNWHDAKNLAVQDGGFMLPLIYGLEFYRLLRSDNDLFYIKGKRIDAAHRRIIVNDIFYVGAPFRREHFDTYFEDGKIVYTKLGSDLKLREVRESLSSCLDDGMINLDEWLGNATQQGLPSSRSNASRKMFYSGPGKNTVAGFEASIHGVKLMCDIDPEDSLFGFDRRIAKILVR